MTLIKLKFRPNQTESMQISTSRVTQRSPEEERRARRAPQTKRKPPQSSWISEPRASVPFGSADLTLLDGAHDDDDDNFFGVNQQKSVYSCLTIMIERWDEERGWKKTEKKLF